MNYEPTNWKTGDLISSTRLNHIEQGIASLYPQEVVIAPEQTVTITSETTPQTGVPITLAEGYDLPVDTPEDWSVTVNGLSLNWDSSFQENGGYMTFATIDETSCVVAVWQVATSPVDQHLALVVFPSPSETPTVVPGDYTVKITKNEPKGLFTVKPGTGNVEWYIDAPIADVDDAYASGLVRLQFQTKENADGQFGIVINLSAGDSLGVLYCAIPSGGDACTWYYKGFLASAASDRYEWRGLS